MRSSWPRAPAQHGVLSCKAGIRKDTSNLCFRYPRRRRFQSGPEAHPYAETPRKPKVGSAKRPRKPDAALHQLVTTGSVKKALTFPKPNERPPQDQID